MATSRNIIRWICVVPAGIIAAALVSFPVHWFVMGTLGGWGIDPVVEIRDPKTLRNIESVLQAAFGPLAFIYFAARTAPYYRKITSVLFAGIVVLGLPILAYWWNTNTISNGSGILIEHGFAWILANVIGAAGAIYLIRSHERKGSDEHVEAEIEKMQREGEDLSHQLELLEDPETICSFGQMAFDGDGVEQDYIQAANWYKMAAEKGHARAQHNLALMYENGQGFSRDLAEAAKWYRVAAEQGNAGSQNNLGALYESGDGVPQDSTIALDLYREAAKGGDENAVSNVHRLEGLMKEKKE